MGFGSIYRCNTTLIWLVCHTNTCTVFFVACPELMLMHCQLTPRMSTQCALHYTCTVCHIALHMHSMHLHWLCCSGKKQKAQLHFIEALLLDTPPPTGTISEQLPLMYLMSMTICVCICSHQIHCGCIGFSLLSQVGRWLILCAPAVCSWPKGASKFQKCPAELSNH